MKKPLISIVIPTRDRPDTLKICLEALRLQNCDRVEILVQDNASEPVTRQIVEDAALRDSRIVYKRSNERLSQRQNFEEGLAAASGDYLGIIGDDDGFCHGRFAWLAQLLQEQRPDAVRWSILAYTWPSLADEGRGFFPLTYRNTHGGWKIKKSKNLAARIARSNHKGSFESILVYHGIISRNLYEVMRDKSNGTFFSYHLPDVYSHTVMPFVTDKRLSGLYIDVNHPISIYGMSGSSSGASWAAGSKTKVTYETPGEKWVREAISDSSCTVPYHQGIRCLKYHDYVSLMIAKDLGLLGKVRIPFGAWMREILKEIRKNPQQFDAFEKAEPIFEFDKLIFSTILSNKKFVFGKKEKKKGGKSMPTDWNLGSRRSVVLPLKAIDGLQPDDILGATHALTNILDDDFGLQKSTLIHKIRHRSKKKCMHSEFLDLFKRTLHQN